MKGYIGEKPICGKAPEVVTKALVVVGLKVGPLVVLVEGMEEEEEEEEEEEADVEVVEEVRELDEDDVGEVEVVLEVEEEVDDVEGMVMLFEDFANVAYPKEKYLSFGQYLLPK